MQALNASTNGGDASRVGILRQKFTDKRVISAVCEPVFVYLHCIIFLMRDEAAEKYFDAGRVARY